MIPLLKQKDNKSPLKSDLITSLLDKNNEDKKFDFLDLVIRVGSVIASLFLAFELDGVSKVFSYSGAIAGTWIAFILPGFLGMKLGHRKPGQFMATVGSILMVI